MYVCGACLFYVCCSDCVGVCGKVCCVVTKYSVILALEWCSMLCVCVVDVMDVLFSVCIVRRGTVGARVWEV